MSFSSLPSELIDLISHFVGSVADDQEIVDFKNLYHLSLVSRTVLPSARRALYYSPFAPRVGLTVKAEGIAKAHQLLDALQADSGRLGRLVRSLVGLSHWFFGYMKEERYNYDELMGADFWYLAVLKACPASRNIECNLASEAIARQLAATISPVPKTVREITFFQHSPRPSDTLADHSAISRILSTLFRQPLENVCFSYLEFDEFDLDGRTQVDGLPISTNRLEIVTASDTLESVMSLLPDPSTVTSPKYLEIAVDTATPTDSDTFHHITRRLGANLEGFDFHLSRIPPTVHLFSYGRNHPGISLPPSAFSTMPKLIHLTLDHTRGPSVALLETLASGSPLLETISFRDSCWVSPSHIDSTVTNEIFPERQVLNQLLKFKCLKSIHVGILPTANKASYWDLRETLWDRGVRVGFVISKAGLEDDRGSSDDSEDEEEEEDDDIDDFEDGGEESSDLYSECEE